MKRSVRVAVVAALMAVPMAVAQPLAHAAYPSGLTDRTNPQSEWDGTATASTWAGLWGDVAGGAAGRPYVTDLSVTVTPANGAAPITQTFVTGGTVTTPASTTPGDITMVISAYNVCNKAKGEVEAPGKCYTTPNRLGGAIAYVKGPNDIGVNFSNPTNGNGQSISTPLLDAIKADGSTTTFDVKINMNTWGKNLRWTWINGKPVYWSVSPLGDPASIVHLKFDLKTGPDVPCDSRVPVEGCNPQNQYVKNGVTTPPDKILKTDFVFSLDNTGVDQVFAGTLFASSNADIGSLEATPVGSPTLGLTYGISGPNELGGAPAVGEFYAVVSDTSLTNYFGVDQATLDSAEFKDSETLKMTRKDGGTTGSQSWTRWTADANGTSSYFFAVTGVGFDGNQVASNSVRSAALKTNYAAKFVMGKKVTSKVSVSKSGKK